MRQEPVTRQARPQVILDVRQYDLSRAEEGAIRENLGALAPQVETFPFADLHVLLEGNARSNDVSVKLTLVLPGTTLVASDHEAVAQPAVGRCLDRLLAELQAYRERLGNVPQRQKLEKGTHQELHPGVLIDAEAVEAAVRARDYPAFRLALLPYEEGVRKRAGRWVQRYPELEARVDHGLELADVVEDIFLLAFEGFPTRPADVPVGTWLEGLVDPALKALQQDRGPERENIEMARSARAAVQGPDNL